MNAGVLINLCNLCVCITVLIYTFFKYMYRFFVDLSKN